MHIRSLRMLRVMLHSGNCFVYKNIMTWFSTIFNDDTLNCRFSQILASRLFPALRVFWKIYRKSLETCIMFEYYLPYL